MIESASVGNGEDVEGEELKLIYYEREHGDSVVEKNDQPLSCSIDKTV